MLTLPRVWDHLLRAKGEIIVIVRAYETDSLFFLSMMSKILNPDACQRRILVVLSLAGDDDEEAVISDISAWYPDLSFTTFKPIGPDGSKFEFENASSSHIADIIGIDSLEVQLWDSVCIVSLVDHIFLSKFIDALSDLDKTGKIFPSDVILYGGCHFSHLDETRASWLQSQLRRLENLGTVIYVFEAFHALRGQNSFNENNTPELIRAIDARIPHLRSHAAQRSAAVARDSLIGAIDALCDHTAHDPILRDALVRCERDSHALSIVTWVASFFTTPKKPVPRHEVNGVCVESASREELHFIAEALIQAIESNPHARPGMISDGDDAWNVLQDCRFAFQITKNEMQFPAADAIIAGAPDSLLQLKYCVFNTATRRLDMLDPSKSSDVDGGFFAQCAICPESHSADEIIAEIEHNLVQILGQ